MWFFSPSNIIHCTQKNNTGKYRTLPEIISYSYFTANLWFFPTVFFRRFANDTYSFFRSCRKFSLNCRRKSWVSRQIRTLFTLFPAVFWIFWNYFFVCNRSEWLFTVYVCWKLVYNSTKKPWTDSFRVHWILNINWILIVCLSNEKKWICWNQFFSLAKTIFLSLVFYSMAQQMYSWRLNSIWVLRT